MSISRKDFLKQSSLFLGGSVFVPKWVQNLLQTNPSMVEHLRNEFNGRSVVIVNLNGGNDGLNTIIPYTDNQYYLNRPDLAINAETVLPINDELGFHPNLNAFAQFWNNGKLAIIENVGYANQNLSHFRSRDIWQSASDSNEIINTGWIARLMEQLYPDYMNNIPEDPLALLQGTSNNLLIRGEQGITGIMVDDPSSFLELVGYTHYAGADNSIPNTFGGDELSFVRSIDHTAITYAQYIQNASDNGTNSVEYPNNSLATQLGAIAKLISGGMYSPFYIVYHNGYDTHNDHLSRHGTLLSELNNSLYSFYTDLSNQDLSEDIIMLTTSEFGRRPFQNGTGTDHGAASVQFLIGDNVNGGLFGSPPDLINVDQNENLIYQIEFRQVYASILSQFLDIDDAMISNILNGEFESLELIQNNSVGSGDVNNDGNLNVIDIVLMVNYILQNSEFTPEQIETADINNDGNINVLDVVAAIDIILNENFGSVLQTKPYQINFDKNSVYIYPQENLAGIQFDFKNSQHINIENKNDNWVCRTNGHRVIAYSTDGKPLQSTIQINGISSSINQIIASNFKGIELETNNC